MNVLIRYHRLFGVMVTTFLELVLYLKKQYALLVKLEAPKDDEEEPDDLITEEDYFPDPADLNKRTTDEWVCLIDILYSTCVFGSLQCARECQC